MFKVFVLGLTVGLASLLLISGASRIQQENAEQKEYQSELLDATPVQSGVLTEKQRAHSKTFSKFRELRSDGLTSLVDRAKTKGSRFARTEVEVGNVQVPQPETPQIFFGKIAQTSDAIIRGRVGGKTSQITENDGFVFTDYDVSVLEIFKNNAGAPLAPNMTIDVAWPGGKVLIKDIILSAIDRNLLPLPTNGHEVVLFLQYLPETGAYQGLKCCVAYELNGTKVQPLTDAPLPPDVIQDRDSFLATVRTVSTR